MRIKQLFESNVGHGDKLTMPDHTVVIDTPGDLDWYKIGQHYPTLAKADSNEFGQGDSDMVISFVSDQEKQAFLKTAKRLGLVTKDISGTDIHPEIHSSELGEGISEASYAGNIGIMELVKFNQKAAEAEEKMLRRLIDAGLNKQAWALVQKVTGVKLVGKEFSDDELTEGWKEVLTNLAISGAIGLGGTAGLVGKQAYNDYFNKSAEKPAVTQQVKSVDKPAVAINKTAPTKAEPQAKAPSKPVEKKIKIQLTTSHPNEKILYDTAVKAGIKGHELAAFMSQMAHESEDFSDMVEDRPNVKKYGAGSTARRLGNKSMNDAKRFIGRGFIQLTGRWNYKWMEKELGIDLTSTWSAAQRAADPKIAAQIAVKFWELRVRPDVSNFKNVREVTKKINSGLHGLESRKEKFKDYLAAATVVPTSQEV